MDKGKMGTALALIGIIAFALFASAYFGYGTAINADGETFHERFVWIGTDPYYHHRVIEYAQQNNGALLYDEPLNNYPVGSRNPRPPLFDYSQAMFGSALAPLFHSDGPITQTEMATGYVMAFFPCIFGALCVIPTYFIGKNLFGRKIGLIAAALLATAPAWLMDSVVGLADHDPFYMFFALCGFALFVKALKLYKDNQSGIKSSIFNNKPALMYAALSGASFAAVALTWDGFLIFTGALTVFAGFEMLMDKMRTKDPSGAWLVAFTALATALVLMLPYYLTYHKPYMYYLYMQSFFTFAVFVAGLIFVPTKKWPGVLVVPSGILAGAAALFVLWISKIYFPTTALAKMGNAIFGNIYYIQKSKVFTTVAEASSVSDISLLVFSFGAVTFFMALAGICWLVWKLWKEWRKDYVFMLVWGAISIYLAITSHRFLSTAAPAVSVLAAFILYGLIQRINFGEAGKKFSSLRPNGFWPALRKSMGARQIAGALFIALMIVLPNVWFAVDAGIPGEVENKWVGEEIKASSLAYTRENVTKTFAGHNLGAFGQGYYNGWIPAMTWLATQDSGVPVEERPAQISWWDYGFYCVNIGDHPTVADPFQEGIPPAGAFLLAQNESERIAIMATRILERVVKDSNYAGFSDGVKGAMLANGLNDTQIAALQDIMLHPAKYREEVLAHPEIFGDYVNASEEAKQEEQQYYHATSWGGLTAPNAMYAMMRVKLSTFLGTEQLASLYHGICGATGFQIRYFAVEERDVTDIYAVFVKLTDRKPDDYAATIVKDQNGAAHTIDEIRSLAEAKDRYTLLGYTDGKTIEYHSMWEEQNNQNYQYIPFGFRLNYETQYSEKFYNSSVYKAFFGYSGYDLFGQDMGIPGYQGQLYQYGYPPMPCWMQKHFRIVYVDPKSSTVRIAKFYEGAKVSGTITDEDGAPIEGATVTAFDDYGIPHDYTTTNATGAYSLIAPFSIEGKNVSIMVTTGSLNPLYKTGSDVMTKMDFPITYEQAMNSELILMNITVKYGNITGTVFIDKDGDGKYNANNTTADEAKPDALVTLIGALGKMNATADENGAYTFQKLLPGTYSVEAAVSGYSGSAEAAVAERETAVVNVSLALVPVPVSGAVGYDYDENGALSEFETMKNVEIKFNADAGIAGNTAVNNTAKSQSGAGYGNYSIKLMPGTYDVAVNQTVNGVVYTYTGMLDVPVASAAITGHNILLSASGAVPAANLTGTVWCDFNNDTIPQAEEYLANVTLNVGTAQAETGADGRYAVQTAPGNHLISLDVSGYAHGNATYRITYSGYVLIHIDEKTKLFNIEAKAE